MQQENHSQEEALDPIARLIELRREQEKLKAIIEDAELEALNYHLSKGGKTGMVRYDDGVSFTFKYVPRKRVPTEEIKSLLEKAEKIEKDRKAANQLQIDVLEAQLKALTTTEQAIEIRKLAQDKLAALPVEKVPQIAISLGDK